MMTKIHPNEVLEGLLASTHRPERKTALLEIHAICELLAQGNARDFSVGTIGTIAESKGLIKRKTLFNKSSKGIVTLIEAWAAFAGRNDAEPPDLGRAAIEDKLMTIPDPALRALIQSRLAERQKLISQVNLLKAATKIDINMSAPPSESSSGGKSLPHMLQESEMAALRHVLGPTFLSDEGWVEGRHGEVFVNETGRRIFPKGFLSALRRVVDSQGP
jgi:hypothetical protein